MNTKAKPEHGRQGKEALVAVRFLDEIEVVAQAFLGAISERDTERQRHTHRERVYKCLKAEKKVARQRNWKELFFCPEETK